MLTGFLGSTARTRKLYRVLVLHKATAPQTHHYQFRSQIPRPRLGLLHRAQGLIRPFAMAIMQVPNEILDEIMSELVADIGPNEAWKYRAVSSRFTYQTFLRYFAYILQNASITLLSR